MGQRRCDNGYQKHTFGIFARGNATCMQQHTAYTTLLMLLLCWCAVHNGHIKRITDEEIQSSVLEIMSSNVSTTFITCPADPQKTLGIKLPFLVMIVKVSSSDHPWALFLSARLRLVFTLHRKKQSARSSGHCCLSATSAAPCCAGCPLLPQNMKKYFSFEVQVLDDKNVRRRFRASNYQVRLYNELP
jgi:hypothetical protein